MTISSNDETDSVFLIGATGRTNPKNRVYVIDDDQAVLKSIQLLLEREGYDVRAYQFSAQFVEELPCLPPGVVVTDQVMNQVSGIEVQRCLLARPHHFRVIIVTAIPSISVAVEAMKSGAVTVLDKPYERSALLQAVAEGFRLLHNLPAAESVPADGPAHDLQILRRLSPREREVIQLVYEGGTNKAIAIRLGVSIKTVEKHRSTAMKKLGVSSLTELIRLMATR